jgi:hypothetical protein
LAETATNSSNSSFSTNQSTIPITEYFDFSSSNPNDDMDIQSFSFPDINDKMDDDDI